MILWEVSLALCKEKGVEACLHVGVLCGEGAPACTSLRGWRLHKAWQCLPLPPLGTLGEREDANTEALHWEQAALQAPHLFLLCQLPC